MSFHFEGLLGAGWELAMKPVAVLVEDGSLSEMKVFDIFKGGKDTVSSASAVSAASLDSTALETAGRDNLGKAFDTKVAPIVEANNFLGLTFCGSKEFNALVVALAF